MRFLILSILCAFAFIPNSFATFYSGDRVSFFSNDILLYGVLISQIHQKATVVFFNEVGVSEKREFELNELGVPATYEVGDWVRVDWLDDGTFVSGRITAFVDDDVTVEVPLIGTYWLERKDLVRAKDFFEGDWAQILPKKEGILNGGMVKKVLPDQIAESWSARVSVYGCYPGYSGN